MKEGKPYVMFGDGTLAACKPISEQDLARFMADCITQVGGWVGGMRAGAWLAGWLAGWLGGWRWRVVLAGV